MPQMKYLAWTSHYTILSMTWMCMLISMFFVIPKAMPQLHSVPPLSSLAWQW